MRLIVAPRRVASSRTPATVGSTIRGAIAYAGRYMAAATTSPIDTYSEQVRRLFTLGPPDGDASWRDHPFHDYAAMGFNHTHVDELIRLSKDDRVADLPEQPAWAVAHACRCLAVIGGPRALRALIDAVIVFDRRNYEIWLEDLPATLACFGADAIGPVAAAARDQRHGFGARLFLLVALEKTALRFPEHRSRLVAVLVDMLKYARYTDPDLNGGVVGALVQLNAVEALPAIRAAFEGDWVDKFHAGDIESVEIDITMTEQQRVARAKARVAEMLERSEKSGLSGEVGAG